MIRGQTKGVFAVGFLFLLWIAIHVLLILVYGGHRELYDAIGYLKGADYILANGRLEDVHHTFYLTHIGIITFFRWWFPNHIFPEIIFQCIVSGVALILLFKTSVTIYRSRFAGFLTCVFFLCWWDNIQWNTILMTESLACSLICFLIFVLSRFDGSAKNVVWISVLLTLGFFTRPTGVITIVSVVFFLIAYYWNQINKVSGLSLFLMTAILIVAVFAADQMFLHWDFTDEYVQGNIVTYMNRSEGTPFYEPSLRLDTSELIIPNPDYRPSLKILSFIYHNPFHFFNAALLKFWYLVSGIRPYYTILHNLFIGAWMLTMYTAFYFGWKQLTNTPLRIFIMSQIVLNCLLVSMSTVDWNNRFYIPMEPAIVLVAGRGAVYIWEASKRLLPFGLSVK